MKTWIPSYYTAFRCIAAACPDCCCKEWIVDVDDRTAVFYRDLDSPLGKCLRQFIKNTSDGTVLDFESGRCPLWREDGLCRIHAELGPDALCQVCREYPRLRHDYGNFVEYGLELSCPEAARLILTQPYTWAAEEEAGQEIPDYDTEMMDILLESRKTATDFLDTTTLPPNQALAVLLIYAHAVQSWLDGAEPVTLDVASCVETAREFAGEGDWALLRQFFLNLEILTPHWRARLESSCAPANWHEGFPLLAKYFIGRYWLQAVSDYDLIGRVKLLVAACLLIYALGGSFVDTAQLFSKEIENDPDNLESILDGAYTSPALTDQHLLSLLLNC